ncbi:MAG: sugar phosphate isomerase/epimerase [Candidatus Gastranaerophilales bacterium]|nr:sugar phosphate isomerase/epimerase [Candidatus Gastranaerophilales bacterium]
MKNRLLISSSAKSTIKESALLAKELNTGLEISRLPFYKEKNTSVETVTEILKSQLGDFKNRITLHAMFSDINISTNDLLLREIAQLRYKQSFEIGKALNVDTILFHTGYKGTKHYGSIKQFKSNFIEFWKEFIKEFESSGMIAVIENVFETEPDFCLELFENINSPNFKLALDAGHVNLYAGKTKVSDWIKAYGNNLYHMHIHNNFNTNDDHSNLENGTLDYKEIFETIESENITPSFVLEMFTENDIRKSIEYLQKSGLVF